MTDALAPYATLIAAATVVSLVLGVGTALLLPVIVARLPADHFVRPEVQRHPVLHALVVVGRNLLGWPVVALGIVTSLPLVPGQGLLTIFIGLLLVDFPGKRRLLVGLLRRPLVWRALTALRARAHQPPLELPVAPD